MMSFLVGHSQLVDTVKGFVLVYKLKMQFVKG